MGNRHPVPADTKQKENRTSEPPIPRTSPTPPLPIDIDSVISSRANKYATELLNNGKFKEINIVITGPMGLNVHQFVQKFCQTPGFHHIQTGPEMAEVDKGMADIRKLLEKEERRTPVNNLLAFLARYTQMQTRDIISHTRDRPMLYPEVSNGPTCHVRVLYGSLVDEIYVRLPAAIELDGMSTEAATVAESLCKAGWGSFCNQYDLSSTLFVYVRPSQKVWEEMIVQSSNHNCAQRDILQMEKVKHFFDELFVERKKNFCLDQYTMVVESDHIDLSKPQAVANAKIKVCVWLLTLMKAGQFGLDINKRRAVVRDERYADGRHKHITSLINHVQSGQENKSGLVIDDSQLAKMASSRCVELDLAGSSSLGPPKRHGLGRNNSDNAIRSRSSSSSAGLGSVSSSPVVFDGIRRSNPGYI